MSGVTTTVSFSVVGTYPVKLRVRDNSQQQATDDTVVQAARFDVLRNRWSSVVTLSAQANVTRAGLWGMVVDSAGQVTVTWSVDDARDGYLSPWIVGPASYTPALDAWQAASHLGRVEAF